MYRQETAQENKVGRNEGQLFDHTEVVFLNCPYCELKDWLAKRKDEKIFAKYEELVNTHDLRRVDAGTYNFYAYFCVVFNNL